jgi:hypothetical protein
MADCVIGSIARDSANTIVASVHIRRSKNSEMVDLCSSEFPSARFKANNSEDRQKH